MTGVWSQEGKRTARRSAERLPTGVSVTLPTWSVLMVSSLPLIEDSTSEVAESISAEMPSLSKKVTPSKVTEPGPRTIDWRVVAMVGFPFGG